MTASASRIRVVAGVIRDSGNRVLISLRPAELDQGGLWEFPGGKLKRGETALAGLRRELFEELGISLLRARPLIRFDYDYPHKSIEFDVWEVGEWSGEPRGCEGQRIQWVDADSLEDFEFPAANTTILNAARLPRLQLVTPEPTLPRNPPRPMHPSPPTRSS